MCTQEPAGRGGVYIYIYIYIYYIYIYIERERERERESDREGERENRCAHRSQQVVVDYHRFDYSRKA